MAAISSFVPSEEIQKLTRGSYESLRSQVESSIEGERERLFGSNSPVQLLGTFSGYAIVLSEEARVFRVKYEQSDRGEIKPISAESLSVPAYTPKTLDAFVNNEARAYVDAFLNGASSRAAEHLQNIVPLVKDKGPEVTPTRITESFENLVKGTRPWKSTYAARAVQIRSSIKEEISSLEEARSVTKFHRLYDGSISKSDLAGYRDLVTSDLKYLGERIDATVAFVEKGFNGGVSALRVESKDPTVKEFELFSSDFIADAKGVQKALSEATASLNTVDDLGKIYDVLASELHRYEVAGQFVGKMSRSLAATAATEEG